MSIPVLIPKIYLEVCYPILMKFNTLCIHAGEETLEYDVTPPIHLSSTFKIKDMSQRFIYSRTDNPTRAYLEDKLAALENGRRALAFSSGMAAISTVFLTVLSHGDEVILSKDLYGGTKYLANKVLPRLGIRVRYLDTRYADQVEREFGDAKLIHIETPSNPMMWISDIEALAEIAHRHGALLSVDNTFASPYIQRPLDLGADISIHSATKYLSGHSDIIAGAAIFKDEELYEEAKIVRSRLGSSLPPFDSYLLLRSIKTLGIRMEAHSRNAEALAEFLEIHPKVRDVYYPFLESFPQYELAKKQMRLGGGMITFVLDTDEQDKIDQFLNSFKFISKAVSLGGVESLIQQPYTMTHASLTHEEKIELGIYPGTIRFSVGLEDIDDLKDDLSNALSQI